MFVLFMVAVPKLPEESVNTSVIYIKDKGLKNTFDSPAGISVPVDVLVVRGYVTIASPSRLTP